MRPRALRSVLSSPGHILPTLSRSLPWICASCRLRTPTSRSYSSAPAKPYYITTPIFYVNAAPHIGHLYTLVLADVLKRWQLLQGHRAILCTGTDEHGMKIQQAAAKANREPKEFCDQGAEVFKSLAARAEILNDHFVRTTEPAHRDAVQYAWFLLKERGYIYESKHEGWYSVSDETFYPQSGVHLIQEPATGRKIMASMETGKEVEWTSETNYHFRLSSFRDRLLQFYRENPDWVRPRNRFSEVISMVEGGLEDLSISRPRQRLSWGIPVPDDDTQTIYVWLDALLNYVTKAGYPWTPGEEHAGGWPADVHVIGKDITRFHCIYWPAILMALDLPLPKSIIAHGHWTLGNQKMAKSVGNVVNPFFALDRFGVDTIRFFLAHDGIVSQDTDYSNYHIITRYKKALQGGIGNLASRIMRGKGWNVPKAIKNGEHIRGVVRSVPSVRSPPPIYHMKQNIMAVAPAFKEHMDAGDPANAVKEVMGLIYETNKFLQEQEPWTLVKRIKEDPSQEGDWMPQVDATVYVCAEALRVAGILLQPFMPTKADHLLNFLGVAEDRRAFEHATFGSDVQYGVPTVDVGKGPKGVLFPPLTSDS